MRVTDGYARAIAQCTGGQCQPKCPNYGSDFCTWVGEHPDKHHKALANDVLQARALIREMAALVYGMANYSTDCTCSMCEEKRMRRDEAITKMEGYL